MEDERNKRIEDHNKMLEAQQKFMTSCHRQGTDPLGNNKDYEKQLSDKTYLINELLKKVKALAYLDFQLIQ